MFWDPQYWRHVPAAVDYNFYSYVHLAVQLQTAFSFLKTLLDVCADMQIHLYLIDISAHDIHTHKFVLQIYRQHWSLIKNCNADIFSCYKAWRAIPFDL